MRLARVTNFLSLGSIKVFANLFYSVKNEWINEPDGDPWKGLKLIVFLHHTSLFEPLLLGGAPWSLIWKMAGRIIAPGASVTMDRPVAGRLLKYVAPKMIPISRERDETWNNFLDAIDEHSVVIIAPEGRMKRPDGLDKHGKPMSVRGGIADILEVLPKGEMVFVYSGGLHHIQQPGQGLPKLFKPVKMRCERVNIQEYVEEMKSVPETSFKKAVTSDMEARMERNVPKYD